MECIKKSLSETANLLGVGQKTVGGVSPPMGGVQVAVWNTRPKRGQESPLCCVFLCLKQRNCKLHVTGCGVYGNTRHRVNVVHFIAVPFFSGGPRRADDHAVGIGALGDFFWLLPGTKKPPSLFLRWRHLWFISLVDSLLLLRGALLLSVGANRYRV